MYKLRLGWYCCLLAPGCTVKNPICSPPIRASGAQVLLVANETCGADRLRQWLEADGHRVDLVDEADAALTSFAERDPPEVVVVALRMPILDAWTLVRRLRTASNDLGVVVVTRFRREATLHSTVEAEYV